MYEALKQKYAGGYLPRVTHAAIVISRMKHVQIHIQIKQTVTHSLAVSKSSSA